MAGNATRGVQHPGAAGGVTSQVSVCWQQYQEGFADGERHRRAGGCDGTGHHRTRAAVHLQGCAGSARQTVSGFGQAVSAMVFHIVTWHQSLDPS